MRVERFALFFSAVAMLSLGVSAGWLDCLRSRPIQVVPNVMNLTIRFAEEDEFVRIMEPTHLQRCIPCICHDQIRLCNESAVPVGIGLRRGCESVLMSLCSRTIMSSIVAPHISKRW
jgi:hypothetical protein